MVGLEVASEVVGAGKLACTAVAHERFVARVESRVTSEVTEPSEHVATLGTHERLLRSVAGVGATKMLSQLRRVRQYLLALATLTDHIHDKLCNFRNNRAMDTS